MMMHVLPAPLQLRAYYDRAPSTLSAASGDARRIAQLGAAMTVAGSLVLLLVIAIMVYALWRRRTAAQPDTPSGTMSTIDTIGTISANRWVLGGGLLMPCFILTGVFLLTLSTLHASQSAPVNAREVIVIGHQWWWEIHYPNDSIVTADEIHIPVGQPVRVRLRSNDVIHSFWAPNLNGKTDLIPGQENVTVLRADSAGVYRAECAEYCGLQHAHMSLSIVAEPPAQFAQWLASAKSPATPVSDIAGAAGLQAFLDHSCAFCHTIRGTPASGTVGPDLTHIGSRLTLAGGTLPNTADYLAAWITSPNALKPGVHMPAVPMDGASLQAIVRYLEGSK